MVVVVLVVVVVVVVVVALVVVALVVVVVVAVAAAAVVVPSSRLFRHSFRLWGIANFVDKRSGLDTLTLAQGACRTGDNHISWPQAHWLLSGLVSAASFLEALAPASPSSSRSL